MAEYVQAWECKGPEFSGYVYTNDIAFKKLAEGCDITAVTIVRHNDGSREYLKGCLAAAVQRHREETSSDDG